MKKLLIALGISIPLLATARENFDEVEQPVDVPIDLYKVNYNSKMVYTDYVKNAFISMTGEISVGEAIEWLATNRNVKKAECNTQICEVEWNHNTEGNGGGEINGTVIGGKVNGGGSTSSSYKISVPCVMLWETISRLDKEKKKDDKE